MNFTDTPTSTDLRLSFEREGDGRFCVYVHQDHGGAIRIGLVMGSAHRWTAEFHGRLVGTIHPTRRHAARALLGAFCGYVAPANSVRC